MFLGQVNHRLQKKRDAKLDREAVVRAVGVEPTQALQPCGFSCRLRLSPPARGARFAVWTIPSPSPGAPGLRCCPSSLYTFPFGNVRPGLARDCHCRFPRIWAVLHRRFPGEHSSFLKSAAYAIPPRPRGCLQLSILEQVRRDLHLSFRGRQRRRARRAWWASESFWAS